VIDLDDYLARLVAHGDPELSVAFLDGLGIDQEIATEIWINRPRAPYLEHVASHVGPQSEGA
jgi:hypothetical protein